LVGGVESLGILIVFHGLEDFRISEKGIERRQHLGCDLDEHPSLTAAEVVIVYRVHEGVVEVRKFWSREPGHSGYVPSGLGESGIKSKCIRGFTLLNILSQGLPDKQQ
jgi:hypothetical protein